MNKVQYNPNKTFNESWILGDLIRSGKTAFIGKGGIDDKDQGLFLITYDRIVFAEEPLKTWDRHAASFVVERFVDVTIIPEEEK